MVRNLSSCGDCSFTIFFIIAILSPLFLCLARVGLFPQLSAFTRTSCNSIGVLKRFVFTGLPGAKPSISSVQEYRVCKFGDTFKLAGDAMLETELRMCSACNELQLKLFQGIKYYIGSSSSPESFWMR